MAVAESVGTCQYKQVNLTTAAVLKKKASAHSGNTWRVCSVESSLGSAKDSRILTPSSAFSIAQRGFSPDMKIDPSGEKKFNKLAPSLRFRFPGVDYKQRAS